MKVHSESGLGGGGGGLPATMIAGGCSLGYNYKYIITLERFIKKGFRFARF
jgi:hypothetical protein